MRNSSISGLIFTLLLAAVVGPHVAAAQAPTASEFYGHGVHAYLGGNSTQAEQHLSAALALNPHDPRLYYFRGLALLRLGRGDEARGDMMFGAQLEAQQLGRHAIGTALSRVQGSDRLLLEQFRRQARSQAQDERRQFQRARYEQIATRDDEVLRRRVTVTLDEFLPDAGPRLSATQSGSPQPQPSEPQAPPPASREGATLTFGDPFADDPPPTEEMPADDGSDETAEDSDELFDVEDEDPFAGL